MSDMGVTFRGMGHWGTLILWVLHFLGALTGKCDYLSHTRTDLEVKGIPSGVCVCVPADVFVVLSVCPALFSEFESEETCAFGGQLFSRIVRT